MNFWHMQLHPNDLGWGRERELLEKYNVIGLGHWDEKSNQQNDFINRMEKDDIVAIKRGSTFIALTKVVGDYEYVEEEGDFAWCRRRRKVEVLDWYQKDYNLEVSAFKTLTICSDKTSKSAKSINKWLDIVMKTKFKESIIDLLKIKKQIILQGPPGTGKTRLAKLIANDLINFQSEINHQDYFDQTLIKFNADDQVKTKREERLETLNQFQKRFPKEELEKMNLENYCMGSGDKNNFCYWMQSGLKDLGRYPAFTDAFLIFWKNDLQKYSKHGFVKDIGDDNEAMSKVAGLLSEIINDKKFDRARKLLGDGFVLKLLNTYYPDEYFPINNEKRINEVLKIFNISFKDKNLIQKNKEIFKVYLNKTATYNLDITPFEFSDLLFKTFNLETGEIINLRQQNYAQDYFQIVQFHPAYSYEDFVRGIVAKTDANGNISYNVENKVIAEIAKKAQNNPNEKYVLIIDEMNRANLPSVLGELIYALEYRDEAVTTMYEFNGDRQIILPKNLYIIGTMNTADRSVGHIDYAIRRRFAFVDVPPNETVIENQKANNLFKYVDILFQENLSPDFKKDDVMIGHSYFLAQDDNQLKIKLDYEIKPILREYVKDGILNESAITDIDSLKV